MPESKQHSLNPGELLNADGRLKEAGYATTLNRRYDRAAIHAGRLRIKEWDYYCIADETVVLALTLADNSYMGLDSASLIDLPMGWHGQNQPARNQPNRRRRHTAPRLPNSV